MGKGQPAIPYRGSARTIAHMARVVGVTPEELEHDGQRPDAAEVLVRILRNEPPPPTADVHDKGDDNVEVEADHTDTDGERIWFVVPKGVSEADRERLRRMAEKLAEEFVGSDDDLNADDDDQD